MQADVVNQAPLFPIKEKGHVVPSPSQYDTNLPNPSFSPTTTLQSLPGARGALPKSGLGPRFQVPHDSLSLNSVSSKTRSCCLYQSIRHTAP